MKSLNVMIVGVGGQGTLLASRVLGAAMQAAGQDVKVSEVHGMSQRGGSVVTYVRAGEKVYSPIINQGEADLILAFEQLEAARWLPYLKKGGAVIVNSQEIDPMPVITGAAEYPEHILDKIKDQGVRLLTIDALSLALEAGSAKAANVVLIGMLSNHMDIPEEDWLAAIRECVPEKFIDLNVKAFALGRAADNA